MRNLFILFWFLAICLIVVSAGSSENNLSERDTMVANLKNKHTRAGEINKIKGTRQTQISALLQILTDYQEAVKKDREIEYAPLETFITPAITLLGDFRASESIKPLTDLMCFEIDNWSSKMAGGTEDDLQVVETVSAVSTALVKIGNPAIPSLIELLKVETPDDYTGEVPYLCTYTKRNIVARKTLYGIEGEFAIYYLGKALNEETDKTKKSRLADAIAKFKEELKSGAYK